MAQGKLRIRLLPNERCIIVRRQNREGEWGKKTRWQVGRTSNLPRQVFFIIQSFVHQKLKACEDKNHYPPAKKAAVRALCEAAKACSCEASIGQAGADVLWSVKDTPLVAFQLHDQKVKVKRRDQLLAGEAIFRWTIAIKKGGYIEIKPRQTNLAQLTEKTV